MIGYTCQHCGHGHLGIHCKGRPRFGIAYTHNGSPPPGGKITGWKKNAKDDLSWDATWDTRNAALEACVLDGWRGYVCKYPTGKE